MSRAIPEYPNTCGACGSSAYVSPISGNTACSSRSCKFADPKLPPAPALDLKLDTQAGKSWGFTGPSPVLWNFHSYNYAAPSPPVFSSPGFLYKPGDEIADLRTGDIFEIIAIGSLSGDYQIRSAAGAMVLVPRNEIEDRTLFAPVGAPSFNYTSGSGTVTP
jgi:hypothetical protein